MFELPTTQIFGLFVFIFPQQNSLSVSPDILLLYYPTTYIKCRLSCQRVKKAAKIDADGFAADVLRLRLTVNYSVQEIP
jgi:hypothetical protein